MVFNFYFCSAYTSITAEVFFDTLGSATTSKAIEGFMSAKSESIFVTAFVSNNGSVLHIVKSDISMPINYITSKMDAPSTLRWSERTFEVIALERQLADADKDWFLLNLDRVGFYRVNYENENWRRVIAAIESQRDDFSHQTIAQLTDDALSFAREGRLSYAIALDMVQNLGEEASMIVWSAASLNLLELNNRLHGLDFYPLFWVSVDC